MIAYGVAYGVAYVMALSASGLLGLAMWLLPPPAPGGCRWGYVMIVSRRGWCQLFPRVKLAPKVLPGPGLERSL